MKLLTKKWQIFLYAMSGLGVNMLNLIVGSYLTDALMVEGFKANVENWTYLNKTLVSAGVWSIMVALAKVLDGVIDIPFAGMTDNLKTRWGKRRPAILMGFVPMVIAYVLFLCPLTRTQSMANTIWYGVLLCVFYSFYTLTMVTYYATFAEVVKDDHDTVLMSNVKSAFDIVYFVLGYALIPMFVGNMNIRLIALMFLPLSLTMLIPLFMIKEPSTKDADRQKKEDAPQDVKLIPSLAYTLKNKNYMLWMCAYGLLQFGLQMFLTAQNVYYSGTLQLTGGQITLIMACGFAPVPFTLILYNAIIKRFGFRTGYLYSLAIFCVAMLFMTFLTKDHFRNDTVRIVLTCCASVLTSFSLGSFFSVNYIVPAYFAKQDEIKRHVSHAAMFFAVQGLFSGVLTAIATGLVWVNLKKSGLSHTMPYFVIGAVVLSFIVTLLLPSFMDTLGRIGKKEQKKA